jgi:hypothetical protein
MRFVKVLLLLAVFVLGLLFFAQNSSELGFVQQGAENAKTLTLQLDLYFKNLHWQTAAVPLYIVILAAFAVGMLFATALLLVDRIRVGCALMSRNRAVRILETEVERLRAEKSGKPAEAKAGAEKELPAGTEDTK